MRFLQVFPTAFLIVICLFVAVTEVNGLKYSVAGLQSAVNYQCCVRKSKEVNSASEYPHYGFNSREIEEPMPLQEDSEAKRFLTRLMTRGLLEECCVESCSHEEVHEGSDSTTDELREECLHEGCSNEEIYEHC